MQSTSAGIVEIKKDARRQVDATDSLRDEVTHGFGKMNTRISLVEQSQKDHEAVALRQIDDCGERFDKIESNGGGRGGINPKHAVVAGGAGATTGVLFRELISFLKGAFT